MKDSRDGSTRKVSGRGEAALIRERLARLGAEQTALEARFTEIEGQRAGAEAIRQPAELVTRLSPARDKIALFRSLFRGREDVYPKRWENAGTSKAGYAPVCANEWVPRLCGKPRVRRGACPHQAFLAVTERYNIASVLIETFVETPRCTSAVYGASGWIHVGTTQGRGRYDREKQFGKPKKDDWLRPLRKDWKRTLNR